MNMQRSMMRIPRDITNENDIWQENKMISISELQNIFWNWLHLLGAEFLYQENAVQTLCTQHFINFANCPTKPRQHISWGRLVCQALKAAVI